MLLTESVAKLPLKSIFPSPTLLEDPPQVRDRPPLLPPLHLFINYPSLAMRVFLSLSEWSSCNCFSLEQLEATQRNRIENHICIRDEQRWREGEGALALLPHTERLLLPFLSSSPSLSSYQLPPPPPASSLAQHGSPCIVFPESSKVDGSLLIRAGFCKLSVGMGELISEKKKCVFVYTPRHAR